MADEKLANEIKQMNAEKGMYMPNDTQY